MEHHLKLNICVSTWSSTDDHDDDEMIRMLEHKNITTVYKSGVWCSCAYYASSVESLDHDNHYHRTVVWQ